jgi:hypothetical protein
LFLKRRREGKINFNELVEILDEDGEEEEEEEDYFTFVRDTRKKKGLVKRFFIHGIRNNQSICNTSLRLLPPKP